MPSISRTLFCTVPAALMVLLLAAPVIPASAMASPLPMPLQADYTSRMPSVLYATRHKLVKKTRLQAAKHNQTINKHLPSSHVSGSAYQHSAHPRHKRQSAANSDDLLDQLSSGRNDAVSSSGNLQQLASQSASNGDGTQFQQDAATQFTSFFGTMQFIQSLLARLAADKGLANYDKTNHLETMLKDIVNANKEALKAVDVMMYNMPGLGPILGPIVYDLKCLFDNILNASENLTDSIISALDLGPLFSSIATQANGMTCSSQLKILGFCV